MTTNNVVVLAMDYLPGISGSPDAQTLGTGEAFVFTGGNYIHGTWSRNDIHDRSRSSPTTAAPSLLQPGRTFIELPRLDSTLPLRPSLTPGRRWASATRRPDRVERVADRAWWCAQINVRRSPTA